MIHSVGQLAALALIGSFGYFISLIIYRLTLHPLAKYPGPFLAKITSWYDAYYGWTGNRYQEQFRCQQKYGNVFRFGPNFLVMQTPEALSEFYLHTKQRPVRKADNYLMNYDHGKVSTAFEINKDAHAFKRRVLGHAFSEHALKAQEGFMIEQIDKWLSIIASGASADTKGWSSPKNIGQYANYLTIDVLGSLCFGKAFGLLDGKYRDLFPRVFFGRTLQFQSLGNSSKPAFFKWLQENTPLERIIFPTTAKDFAAITTFVKDAFKERQVTEDKAVANGEPPRQDFIHWLVDAKDPATGQGYSATQMNAELRLLLGAGSDTTSTTIAAALFFLTRNPKAMQKLQAELRSNFSDVNDIVVGPESNNCLYLKAVIEETLRMAPPIPSALKRITEAPLVVGGIDLPAGTEVGTAAWGIHHSDEYFPEASKFKPERWLHETTSKEQLERMKTLFTPFSQGNRACIGKNMAYNELTIALGRMFWTYDVRLAAGDTTGVDVDGFYNLIDTFISQKDGPVCEFRKRTDL